MSRNQSPVQTAYLADHPDGLPKIARWQHAAFGYLNPSATLDERLSRLRLSLQARALPLTLVALNGEAEIVGCAGLLASTIVHRHLTPWLSSVYVPAEHRSRGIAASLSLRAVSEAARLGYGQLYLFTPKSQNLYARLGWSKFDECVHLGTTLTLMKRKTRQGSVDRCAGDL